MDVRALKDSATRYFSKGRFSRAAECYAQLCEAEPREGQHYIKLGDSHRRDGRRDAAVEAYRRAVDEYVRQGVIIKAIAACKLILEIEPEHQSAQQALADLCSRRYVKSEPLRAPTSAPKAVTPPPAEPHPMQGQEPSPPPSAEQPNVTPSIIPFGEGPHGRTPLTLEPEPSAGDSGLIVLSEDVLEELTGEADVALAQVEKDPVAESTSEQEVLQRAESAARRPPTTVAAILRQSLVLEGEDEEDEEELVSVRCGDGRDEPLLPGGAASAQQPGTPSSADAVVPRVDVEQLRVPLLSGLPREAFLDLLARMKFRRFAPGEAVVREGEVGRSLFVVATGRVRVVKGLDGPAPTELAVLDEGAFFGEMSLLDGAPRVASVLAVDECELLELTDEILRELTARHPSVAQALQRFYRQRLLANVMSISPIFRAFGAADQRRLMARFKLREAGDREAIIREGQAADGLYVLLHGVALVTKKRPGAGEMPLAVLRAGDVFGEMALLTRRPASATVTTRRRSLVLRLPKADFEELMFTHPVVLEVVSQLSAERVRVNALLLEGKAPVPPEALSIV